MRIWHYKLLSYLPDLQFKGQLRELVAIMRAWRDSGATNHLLINKVMEFEKAELTRYFIAYEKEFFKRYGKRLQQYEKEFLCFGDYDKRFKKCYSIDWHTKDYLRVCMANLYEKHNYGNGKSRITDKEWQTLLVGYKEITGEEYQI